MRKVWCAILVFLTISGFSWIPCSALIQWSQTYGVASNDEVASQVIQTADGGYTFAGWSGSGSSSMLWLVKTDSNGQAQWNKTYSGRLSSVNVNPLVQTTDGGYALFGYFNTSFDNGNDFLLVKTDSSGNVQWNKTYNGGIKDERGCSIIKTNDGGYALLGDTNYTSGIQDYFLISQDYLWLIKTDSNGNTQWNKTYGSGWRSSPAMALQTNDGGYALLGTTWSSPTAYSGKIILVKTDSNGNMQWNKTFSGLEAGISNSIVKTSDGGYALLGITMTSTTPGWKIWLIKTDSSGNTQWNQTYGIGQTDAMYSIVQSSDGGFVMAGNVNVTQSSNGYPCLLKTDSFGVQQWNLTYSNLNGSYKAYWVTPTLNSGYAIAGVEGASIRNAWLAKDSGVPTIPEFPAFALALPVIGAIATTAMTLNHPRIAKRLIRHLS